MTVTSTGESGCSLRVAIQAVAANDSGTACGAVVSGGPTPINLPANTITPFDGQIVVPAGVNVQINGVQATGGTTIGAYFRLLVDGGVQESTRQEFNHNGWELRGVTLSRLLYLAAGSHTIAVQWAVTSGTLTCCWYGDIRQIQVIEQ